MAQLSSTNGRTDSAKRVAARTNLAGWRRLPQGGGFIVSFRKHSLLVATIAVACLVVFAQNRWRSTNTPAAAISNSSESEASGRLEGSAKTPTPRVLQAKPITPGTLEVSPVPPHSSNDNSSITPVSPADLAPLPIETEDNPPLDSSQNADPSERGELPRMEEPGERDATPPADAHTDTNTSLPRKTVTKANDSFWSIAERAYGDGGGVYYRALFRHNRTQVLRPDQLRAGITLEVPPIELLKQLYPDDCPVDSPAGHR